MNETPPDTKVGEVPPDALRPFPDLSTHVLRDVLKVGTIPVPKGSAPSYHAFIFGTWLGTKTGVDCVAKGIGGMAVGMGV